MMAKRKIRQEEEGAAVVEQSQPDNGQQEPQGEAAEKQTRKRMSFYVVFSTNEQGDLLKALWQGKSMRRAEGFVNECRQLLCAVTEAVVIVRVLPRKMLVVK